MIGRWSATAARRSTRCVCGARPPLIPSIFKSSAAAISSPRSRKGSTRNRSPAFSIRTTIRSRGANCGSCRNIFSSPVRWPTRSAGFGNRIPIGGFCPRRPPFSSTTRTRPSPCRNSCASCSTKRISAGTKRGISRARRSPTPTTLCFPRRSSVGRSSGCASSFRASSRSSSRSTAGFSTTFARIIPMIPDAPLA